MPHILTVARDNAGNALGGALVTVYAGTVAGGVIAPIYSDALLSVPKANPFTTDDSGRIEFYVASVATALKVEKAGIGEQRYEDILGLTTRPVAAVSMVSTAVSLPSVTWSGVTAWDTTHVNVGGMFAANRMTAPSAGLYVVSATLLWEPPGASNFAFGLEFRKNGTSPAGLEERHWSRAPLTDGDAFAHSVTVLQYLAPADYLEVRAFHSLAGNRIINPGSRWSVYRAHEA